MLKQLRNTFSSFRIFHESGDNPENYQWFITNDNQIIGMDKAELTKKDTAILSAFLTPYDTQFPVPTTQEKLWIERIHGSATTADIPPFRFVYFTIRKNQINLFSFKEAIHTFFAKPIPILWKNEQEGIIVEEQSSLAEENISYEQIIDVLMSDLYVKLKFIVGPYLGGNLTEISKHYKTFLENAEIVLSYSEQSVITYVDAIPSLLVHQANSEFRSEVTSLILQEFAADDGLLDTIKMFMHCNLNVSLTAKELYMHRNSLQYRLDKFIDKTGIDVRQFHQALTVYLAILGNMHKDK